LKFVGIKTDAEAEIGGWEVNEELKNWKRTLQLGVNRGDFGNVRGFVAFIRNLREGRLTERRRIVSNTLRFVGQIQPVFPIIERLKYEERSQIDCPKFPVYHRVRPRHLKK
jgi:hypothetical protein